MGNWGGGKRTTELDAWGTNEGGKRELLYQRGWNLVPNGVESRRGLHPLQTQM